MNKEQKDKLKENLKPNEVTKDVKKSIVTRTITAFVALLVVVPCIFLGGWFYFALIIAVTGIGAYEIVRAAKPAKNYKVLLYIMTIIFVYAIVFWVFVRNNVNLYFEDPESYDISNILTNSFKRIEVSTLFILASAGFYLMLTFFSDQYTIADAFYYFGMTLILGLSFQALLYLRYTPFTAFSGTSFIMSTPAFQYGSSTLLLLYTLIGVCFNDIGAYFVGILLGKHKMNPRISPKKTWEGFAGGIIISVGLTLTFSLVLAATGNPILPQYDLNHWYYILIVSLSIPVIADLGDFVFSAIKRHFGIKDYGIILPGHGGILDRVDSILFACSAVAVITQLITYTPIIK